MRVMAGHPEFKGGFEIRRAGVTRSPRSLLRMIWPELSLDDADDANIEDLAGKGFRCLLRKLRDVILQDSVSLKRAFPNHPLWRYPVFRHPDYVKYAATMEASGTTVTVDDVAGEQPSANRRVQEALV
jgi:centromere DNA-binding complex CBF3 subunit-like protein